jgi:hypothetical protein
MEPDLTALSAHPMGEEKIPSNAQRFDTVTPPMLGMGKVVSEDSARRNLKKLDQIGARRWQGKHLHATWERLLCENFIRNLTFTFFSLTWMSGRFPEKKLTNLFPTSKFLLRIIFVDHSNTMSLNTARVLRQHS